MTDEKSEIRGKENVKDENTIYIGKKSTRGYVLAVITQFSNGLDEVTMKARGKLISRAVDVSQIVINKFMPNCEVKNVVLSTEELTSDDGRKSNVSSIEIVMRKKAE